MQVDGGQKGRGVSCCSWRCYSRRGKYDMPNLYRGQGFLLATTTVYCNLLFLAFSPTLTTNPPTLSSSRQRIKEMEADNSQLSRKISVLEDENQRVKQVAEGLRVQLNEISCQHERCGSRISVLEERVTQADAGLEEEQGRCVCVCMCAFVRA